MENMQCIDRDDKIIKSSLESRKKNGENEEGIDYYVAMKQLLNGEQYEEELPDEDEKID